MRTIQVINTQWYNATAWYALYLTHILNAHGHKSLLITCPKSALIPKIKEFGLEYRILPLNSFNPKEIFYSWNELNGLCKSFRPDIINCHRGESFYMFGMLKKSFGIKLIRTRGDQRLPKVTLLNRFLHNKTADNLIVTNSSMADFFINIMKTPASRVHTILGGVDTGVFYPHKHDVPAIRKKYGFSEDDVLLGIVGRLDPVKGFHESIAALKKCLDQSEDARNRLHLLIAGRACCFTVADLMAYAKTLGVPQTNIHFYEFVHELNDFMNMLDVGLIASVGSETIARVAFEMLACHTPVIGSRVGVMPDILQDGFLFRPGNIDEMAAMFLNCLDEKFRTDLQKLCMRNFYGTGSPYVSNSVYGWSMEDFYTKTINVYSKTLEGRL